LWSCLISPAASAKLAADLRRGEGLLLGGPARKPGWPNLDGKLTEDAFAVAELTEGTVCCTLLSETAAGVA
jgi:hypothetical protein